MTRIDFYFNAENKLRTACRIAAKAALLQLRVTVLSPDEETARSVDQLMWSFKPTGFSPHCRSTHPLALETPIVITSTADQPTHDEVLVNLDDQPPSTFGRFLRLIEIVGRDPEDRAIARLRFRFYKDRGYEITHHDLSNQDEKSSNE